jgi:uncharacterized protein
MEINEVNAQECSGFLERASLGRLGCSFENQPHVVPVHFAYDGRYLYVFSTYGQKVKWMRGNPRVCVQMDEIHSQSEWISVIVYGEYEELTEPQYSAERAHAALLLGKRYHWWLNALGERQMTGREMSLMRCELQTVLDSLQKMRPEQLPGLLGELEIIRATALLRLSAPAVPDRHDELVTVQSAAERLGISTDYLYRHADQFPFTRRMGRKLVFSSLGIDEYIRRRVR